MNQYKDASPHEDNVEMLLLSVPEGDQRESTTIAE